MSKTKSDDQMPLFKTVSALKSHQMTSSEIARVENAKEKARREFEEAQKEMDNKLELLRQSARDNKEELARLLQLYVKDPSSILDTRFNGITDDYKIYYDVTKIKQQDTNYLNTALRTYFPNHNSMNDPVKFVNRPKEQSTDIIDIENFVQSKQNGILEVSWDYVVKEAYSCSSLLLSCFKTAMKTKSTISFSMYYLEQNPKSPIHKNTMEKIKEFNMKVSTIHDLCQKVLKSEFRQESIEVIKQYLLLFIDDAKKYTALSKHNAETFESLFLDAYEQSFTIPTLIDDIEFIPPPETNPGYQHIYPTSPPTAPQYGSTGNLCQQRLSFIDLQNSNNMPSQSSNDCYSPSNVSLNGTGRPDTECGNMTPRSNLFPVSTQENETLLQGNNSAEPLGTDDAA